jgi:hypothetical protein
MIITDKPIIVTDVDDVLVDCRSSIAQCMKTAFNKSEPEFWHSYSLPEVFGVDDVDIFKAFKEHSMIENTLPHPDAIDVITAFKSMGFTVVALTARGWHPNGHDLTTAMFNEHNIPIDHTIAIPVHSSKAEVMNQFSTKPFLFVDDHIRHIENALEHDCAEHIIVRTQDWNENFHHQDVKRVGSLTDLLKVVKQIYL